MIVDVNAYAGHWPFRRVRSDLASVRNGLRQYGVGRIYVSPLDAAWSRNPHQPNDALYDAAAQFEDVRPVPVLDPTIATWRTELARAREHPEVRLAKLLPGYSPYALADADELLRATRDAGLSVICQTRLEDRRRQHPLAEVADVPVADVVAAAERHPELNIVVGGASSAQVRTLRGALLGVPNLYAATSQIDGLDAVRILVDNGLSHKLLFGSHAPLFTPYAGLARVVTDIDDASAVAILGGNALRLFG